MGSLERQLVRTQLKMMYQDFTKKWHIEKFMVRAQKEAGQKLTEDQKRILGRKPSLSMFIKRIKQIEEQNETTRLQKLELKKIDEEKIDKEWKED